MNVSFLVFLLLVSVAMLASVLLLQRRLLRGARISSISLLERLTTFSGYLLFAAAATALLSMVLLRDGGAFFRGFVRIVTGSELFRTDSSADVLAALTFVFAMLAIGFDIVRRQAERSRSFRRYLMGFSRTAGDALPIPADPPASKSNLDTADRTD